MTRNEVKGLTEFGPYKNFKNGDLETFEGLYDGKKENFQFFFKDGKLWRIGISFYEGVDLAAGGNAWLRLYKSLHQRFGPVETRGNTAPEETKPESFNAFTRKAAEIIETEGKTQIAPLRQPGDAFVFASFERYVIETTTYYHVMLFLNRDR